MQANIAECRAARLVVVKASRRYQAHKGQPPSFEAKNEHHEYI